MLTVLLTVTLTHTRMDTRRFTRISTIMLSSRSRTSDRVREAAWAVEGARRSPEEVEE